MPRRDIRNKILPYADLSNLTGLELGALHDPVVARAESHILYGDHAGTEALKQKYAHNPGVPNDKIVDVDVIWGVDGAPSLPDHSLDYVIASHVMEHVPNLLGWLEHVRRVLKPNGVLGLAVPDKRFTFDFKRRETSLADIVHASLVGATAPLPICVLDHFFNAVHVDLATAWDTDMKADALPLAHPREYATVAAKQVQAGEYIDCHCWVFTPRSLAELFEKAVAAGLTSFKCIGFHDTHYYEPEFFVHLSPCDDRETAVQSWRSMAAWVFEHRTDAITYPRQKAAA
jgi:SAM-dependent methyltransferase